MTNILEIYDSSSEAILEIFNNLSTDIVEITTDAVDIIEITTDAVDIIEIVSAGIVPGPKGADGLPGGSTLSYPAGEVLSGHRMVVLENGELFYASKDVAAHATKVLGMTVGATMQSEIAEVQTGGEIVEPSWAWTLDVPVWLSVNGLLSQVPPTSGFSLIIGFPISSTKLLIRISEPLFLI